MTEVRWGLPWRTPELDAMGKEAFLSGHWHLFDEEERRLLHESNSLDIFNFSWTVPPIIQIGIAVDDVRLVGAIGLHREYMPGSYSLIEPMNVHPDYQRKGLGTRLWNLAADFCEQAGDKGLKVWALDGNEMAMSFYRDKLNLSVIGKGHWWLIDHMLPATGFQLDF